MSRNVKSLYDTALIGAEAPNPYPPGTVETAQVETLDNDVASLMLDAGVIR